MHQYAWEFIPLGICQTSFNLVKLTGYLTLLPGRIKPGMIVFQRKWTVLEILFFKSGQIPR